jgi:hypothetical protein
VTLDGEFPHVIQALDDLGPLSHNETYSTRSPDLSAYGHCLLIEQSKNCVAGSGKAHHGVYQGLLDNKRPITWLLTGDDLGDDNAVCFYDRHRIPIPLAVKPSQPNHLVLERRADTLGRKAVTETFDLAIAVDGMLSGQWMQH